MLVSDTKRKKKKKGIMGEQMHVYMAQLLKKKVSWLSKHFRDVVDKQYLDYDFFLYTIF